MKTTHKIISIGLLCLILGGVTGFFIAGRITKKRIHEMVEMQRPPGFKSKLEERLKLTPEQKETVEQRFREHVQRMRSIDRGIRDKREAEIDRLFSELEESLTEEQMETLREFRKRMRKRGHRPPHHRRRHMK
ncbi:MAG: hypothetical protein JJ975_00035 [Bacteroidia bacterium]|nr:hypothetical protein [Bacteroidia bacterium]